MLVSKGISRAPISNVQAVARNSLIIAMSFLACLHGCQRKPASPVNTLRLAVTTSTRDSGLLDILLPNFEASTSSRVDVLAVGTGAALKLGEAGDVDVVLCHARKRELEFLQAGHAIRHEPLMENSFVLLGPQNDPADIAGCEPSQALAHIRKRNATFVSRADQSGTHLRELALWHACERQIGPESVETEDDDFKLIETGQGMGASLIIANEMNAYILSDRGTYLNFKTKIELVPLVESGTQLENPYGLLVVNPNKNKRVNATLANAFADFMVSPNTQRRIAKYQVSGEQLFRPLRQSRSK